MKNKARVLFGVILLICISAYAADTVFQTDVLKFGRALSAAAKNLVFEIGKGSANPIIRSTTGVNAELEFANDGVNFSPIGSGSGSGSGFNAITKNPDYESGVGLGWTNTGGTFLAVSTAPNLLFGRGSATFQASATAQSFQSDLYDIPVGLQGGNCSTGLWYKGGDTNLKLQAVDGSGNVLSERVFAASTIAVPYYTSFVCPSTGQFRLKVVSTAASALIAVDRTFLGENSLIAISNAQFFGSAKWPGTASCNWVQNSATFVSFPVDADCTFPSGANLKGNALAPATKIPAVKFATLPPGHYLVMASLPLIQTGNNVTQFRIFDGTSAGTGHVLTWNGVATDDPVTLINEFDYTTAQSNVTFEIQENNDSGVNVNFNLSTASPSWDLTFTVYYYPNTQQQGFNPDQVSNSWSGYHDTDCAWSTTSATPVDPTDSSCTLFQRTNTNFGTVTSANNGTPGVNIPGIVFTPSRVGKYFVCASVRGFNTDANQTINFILTDGTTVVVSQENRQAGSPTAIPNNTICGEYQATSVASKTLKIQISTGGSAGTAVLGGSSAPSIEWSIFQIDQSLPAALLVNSVVSSSLGVELVNRATITQSAPSTCSIVTQSGSWLSGVTCSSNGTTNLLFNPVFSANPSCVVTPVRVSAGDNVCAGHQVMSTSTTVVSIVDCASASLLSRDYDVVCMGPK